MKGAPMISDFVQRSLGRTVKYNDADSVQRCHFEGRAARRRKGAMKSTVVKRSIVLAGHKTSVSLEDAFWEGLKDIAKARRVTLSDLVGGIDTDREHANLSSAIRLFVLNHYQARAARSSVELAA
jgi:predicted DNA-binding ribbon-helix-helix protein